MSLSGNMYDSSSVLSMHSGHSQHQQQQQQQPPPQPQPPQQQQPPPQQQRRTGFSFHRRIRRERQQEQQIEQMFTDHAPGRQSPESQSIATKGTWLQQEAADRLSLIRALPRPSELASSTLIDGQLALELNLSIFRTFNKLRDRFTSFQSQAVIHSYQRLSPVMELDYDFVLEDEFDAVNLERRKDFEAWSSQKYPAKQHARKVAAELGVRDGLIYLPVYTSFFYITGANFHDCSVTYEIAKDRLILWIPYVEPRQLLWFGSTPSAAKAMQLYDVDEARYTNQLSTFLDRHLRPSTTLYLLHPDQTPPLAKTVGKVDGSSLQAAMNRARSVKDAYEIAMIRRANDVSSAAHRKVAENLLGLTNERDMEAIFQAVCTARGTRSQAYPVIAGAGANASTLHYEDNDQPLKGKELVVFDAGCEWNCYASDVTRTLPISGKFSPRAAAIYSVVQRMQEDCIAAIKPGVEFHKLHLHAAAVGLAGLLKLGILKGNAAEVADAGTVTAFFPHGLGHHVGLEVHDVPGDVPLLLQESLGLEGGKRQMVTANMLSEMRRIEIAALTAPASAAPIKRRQILQPNMIVTVEPGIYFCREFIEGYYLSNPIHAKFIDKDVLEGYYSVGGVRIEDDILVTEDGYENLTAAPKGEELVKVINGGKAQRK
ncbi:putative Xaa-Pro aminopeptidase [Cladobotryum mycophilum]|uniref:Xaa-Pro aminopeptidase n=1 Tax=Cladobotryum mycophilum TaxID=491253 RepID=A0ABR0SZD4_9HYPO